jgi:Fe2+ or Zn2+ uptake regulation protein
MRLRVELSDQDERVWARLHSAGVRLTSHRRTILALFFASTQPVTTNDLWHKAIRADPRTSSVTVRRLLNALVECGLAHREISPADGILRYGPVKVECTHERVACKDCGATISAEGGQHDHVVHEGKE